MNARLLLLGLPLGLILLLLQAGLWVPGFDAAPERFPHRTRLLVEATSGDARLLNPILFADTASARITGLVFDGLLRIDEDMNLVPDVARRFAIGEHIHVLSALGGAALAEQARELRRTLPQRLRDRLGPERTLPGIDVRVLPAIEEVRSPGEGPGSVSIAWPERILVEVDQVVPELADLIDVSPPTAAARRALLRADDGTLASLDDATLETMVPGVERNPRVSFWLRDDVRFHDGHVMDAEDVRFTVDAILEPRNRSPRRSDFEPVKRVEILAPDHLVVVYKRLFSPAVSAWTMGILPAHLLGPEQLRQEARARGLDDEAVERFTIRDSGFNRAPVGSGPYRFRAWRSDEYIELEARRRHHRGSPLTSGYYFRIMPDPLTREIEFRAGATDSYLAQPHQAQRYRADRRFQSLSTTQPGYTYVGYNLRRAPFDDPRFRRALGMAIDTDAIIRYVMFEEADRVTGPFASISPWYDDDVAALPHDPEAAAQLLQEMGYERGEDGMLWKDGKALQVSLITNNGNPQRRTIATILQREWQRLGVRTTVQLFEWAVFLKDFINPGDFDAVVLGWRLGLDPDLYQIWHSSQTGESQLNFVGFQDDSVDRIIEAIRVEYDPGRQRDLTYRMHRRIAELQPYTFLFAPRSTRVLDRRMRQFDAEGRAGPVRAGGAGDPLFHMHRWSRSAHAQR